ncbi:ABC transporter substrate-binding protein [Streptomyces camelliae]|uniref:ABC transporter substrate-binding protein n=1 Tax=Streptomyces camelliae TaxID=3004093 RepID=A0ABY7P2W9_9ACTN|nr:ABC transporter substrate-binding protein [Streptomyces sp. HUAS 2-6]WBO64876.1 ABC transporter substrate-binding protein [Streptomyces sp. HUAS 2-6]
MSKASIAWDPRDSRGPARPVPGAVRGGTLRILRDADHDHLDPQRIQTIQATALGHLLFRTLTMFAEDGEGGWRLVGDLAEHPGRDVDGDGRTWEFTLKPGLRYEDGRPIAAADVAHGIARSFEESLAGGPQHLQDWLRAAGPYAGPFTDGTDEVPGLEVRDARTLVFRFPQPRPDLPFAAALVTTVPVPRDADTGESYGKAPLASGPYRIAEHVPGERLVLERNPHWDPATDAVRHDHPDRVELELGVDAATQNRRAHAGEGPDAVAVAENNAPEEVAAQLLADPALGPRLRRDRTPLVWYLAINTARVTDVAVRREIARALDKEAVLGAMAGATQGEITHSILSPATIGHRPYPDPHAGGPRGLPDSWDGRTLRLLSRDGAYFTAGAAEVRRSLEAAGFAVELVEIERPRHNAAVLTRGHAYDLYLMCQAADWPGASTLLTGFDGRTLRATGNANYTYLDDPGVNAEIARVSALPADLAAPEWAALDETLTTCHIPLVPVFSYVYLAVRGPRVGGVFTSSFLGTPVYYDAYVTPAAQGGGRG